MKRTDIGIDIIMLISMVFLNSWTYFISLRLAKKQLLTVSLRIRTVTFLSIGRIMLNTYIG
jgi:hypothetical protein